MNRRLMAFTFLIVIALSGAALPAQAQVDVNCATSYHLDPSGRLNANDESALGSVAWEKFRDRAPGFGFSRDVLWVKVECQNDGSAAESRVVSFDYPLLDKVIHYGQTSSMRFIQLGIGGDTQGPTGSALKDRNPAFIIRTPPGKILNIFRISTLGSLQAPISIFDPKEYESNQRIGYFLMGTYYGVMGAVFLYNLIIFVTCFDVLFLIYSLFIVAYFNFQMSANGLWSSHFGLYWVQNQGMSFAMFSSVAMIIAFASTFLRTQGLPAKLVQILLGAAGVLLLMAVISPLIPYQYTAPAGAVAGTLVPILVLVLSATLWRRGNRAAQVFTIAWGCYLAGTMCLGIKNLGLIPPSFWTNNSIQIGSALEMMLISAALGMRFRDLEQSNSLIESKYLASDAVARMTQMLAHDVRKPFSILRMGLGMLGSAKDPAAVKAVLSRLVPEIDKAVSSVDGLIADVMEVGSSSTALIQELASPESLIEATLGETFRIYPKASIEIGYDLRHTHMANVHVQKVGRVFSNIVGNAVHAMGQKGRIWFKTRERDGLIEFCLGNAGSVIPAESLPKLFDAFFTSGKKGGTGLGLAIAEKVVKAHGGRI